MPRKKISIQLAPELSNRELLAIGRIVSRWGLLEYEVFSQTVRALPEEALDDLPKAMNNIQFTGVLALWKEHVVGKAKGRCKMKLEKCYDRITKCHDYRTALVHGMWDWNPSAPEKIAATRIRKRQIITTHFTASDLEDFANTLGEINYDIVYPGGLRQHASAMAAQGFSMGRMGLALMTSDPIIKDFFPTLLEDKPGELPATGTPVPGTAGTKGEPRGRSRA
jgi:hypothetical protein